MFVCHCGAQDPCGDIPAEAAEGPTPRTDALLLELGTAEHRLVPEDAEALLDHACDLERELAAMTADRDHFFELSGWYLERANRAESGLAEAKGRIDDLKCGMDAANQRWLAARSSSAASIPIQTVCAEYLSREPHSFKRWLEQQAQSVASGKRPGYMGDINGPGQNPDVP